MVIGIEKFKEYFKEFPENYIIIGGTACDFVLAEAGLIPRATRDIDMVIIVEALKAEFVRRFWDFIKAGEYEKKQSNEEKRNHYRFLNPLKKEFPSQVELFSRMPGIIDFHPDIHLTPIPVEDDLSSLSAILLDGDYYNYTISNCTLTNGINCASPDSLICLKAKAFLDLNERRKAGEAIDSRKIKKHKTDIFRLATLFGENNSFVVPGTLKRDLSDFVREVKDDLPEKQLFRDLGIPELNVEALFQQLKNNFNLVG
ncbi:MAG: hypothetical protein ACOXZO_00770 [Bacteroidales bacterium]